MRSLTEFEIVEAIVVPNAIPVMHFLARGERPSKRSL